MLDDHERDTLRDIQRRLFVEDPDLERSFRDLEVPAPQTHLRLAYTAGIVIAVLLTLVGLLAGSAGGALLFATIAGLAWLAQHLHVGATNRVRDD